ncbi:MAG TPA: DUF5667 domain-containing protein [Candidatus Woesebacteria bacterium]|jgi:hypothetical protein|nr:hypothetical protein [Candidatus Shapirobacteria bacterium]HOR01938.1 DUF5667 domain-containing protein [Candidatus Woesebacteria bacterium]
MKLWLKILMVAMSLIILYVSFARAGLEKVSHDERYDQLRKISIAYHQGNECYRLPESRTLPDSPFYFLKKIRDDLWIHFTNNPVDKIRIGLLVADKKMTEVIMMQRLGKTEIEWKDNLMEAEAKILKLRQKIADLNPENIEVQELDDKINRANSFYEDIIEQLLKNETIRECYE